MVSTQGKLVSEQKHSEMLDGADHCVKLDFIRSIVVLRTGEGPREEAHWMLEARIIEALFEHCFDCDATAVSFENEGSLGIR